MMNFFFDIVNFVLQFLMLLTYFPLSLIFRLLRRTPHPGIGGVLLMTLNTDI